MKTYKVITLIVGDETKYYSDTNTAEGFLEPDTAAICHFLTNSKYTLSRISQLIGHPINGSSTEDCQYYDINWFNPVYWEVPESEITYHHIIDIGVTLDGKRIKFLQNF